MGTEGGEKEYIIIYDLPSDKASMLVKVNRMLHKMGAKKIQHSVWQSDDLEALKEIVYAIKRSDGQARILEKRIVV